MRTEILLHNNAYNARDTQNAVAAPRWSKRYTTDNFGRSSELKHLQHGFIQLVFVVKNVRTSVKSQEPSMKVDRKRSC